MHSVMDMFFTNQPYACDPSSLPKYPPSKEMDAKLQDEEARNIKGITNSLDSPNLGDFYGRRLRAAGKSNAGGLKKSRDRDRAVRTMPALEANAELQANLDII